MRRLILALTAGALTLAIVVPVVTAGNDPIRDVKRATARFNSIEQAGQAGYGPFPPGVPLHECIMALDGSGGMGIHWLNGSLLDGVLDPTQPEVLVYQPDAHGNLKLVALEYVVFDEAWTGPGDPTILGQPLFEVPAPNRYEIPSFWERHLWLYEDNAAGAFSDFNPAVTCG